MAMAGEKFVIDLSDDEDEEKPQSTTLEPKVAPAYYGLDDFVGDIVERKPTDAKAPTMPVMKSTTTGFPEHKKRSRFSTFKSQRAASAIANTVSNPPTVIASTQSSTSATPSKKLVSFEDSERTRIDKENNQRIADMSQEEIRRERAELMSSLSPELIEMMLKRANLDDGRGDTWVEKEESELVEPEEITSVDKPIPVPAANAANDQETVRIPEPSGKRHTAAKTVEFTEDDEVQPSDSGNIQPVSQFSNEHVAGATPSSMHFPTAPQAPDLDPSDPAFLSSLHEKYFPSLPADPSKLAWMAPIPTPGSVADQDSPYYPGATSMNASALRFDFRGALLPPRIARALPTTKGLHHHGEAPESAGYTVPELSRLSRSAFPAQRCIAFQTLGRLLYKMGRGQYGDEKSEIALGLWKCVEDGKIVETLEESANAPGGHQGSKVYAIEALWLFQSGGGKVWKRKTSMAGV